MRVPLTAIALIFEFTRPSPEFMIPVLIAVAGSVAMSSYVRQFFDPARRPDLSAKAERANV
jgi:H+/Cl- antiporter ClcA